MAQAGGVSRRDLFGRGLARLLENRLAAIDAVTAGHQARTDDRRPGPDLWEWGGYGRLGEQLGPAAEALTEAAGIGAGRRVLDLEGGGFRARGSRLPFDDAEFDGVVSCFGATHAPAQAPAVREMRRVVRPGGMLAVSAWEPTGFMGALLRAAARTTGDARLAEAARWGRYEHAYRAFGLLPDFELQERVLDLRFASAEDAWEALGGTGGPLAGADVRDALASALEAHARPEGAGMAIAAAYVVVTAREPGA